MSEGGHTTEDSRPGPPDPNRRRFLAWLWRLPVLAALAGGIYAVLEGGRVLFRREPASERPEFAPVEPVDVAPLESFTEPWAAEEFQVAGIPAIAIRLPQPIPAGISSGGFHLAGFSRVCTHQGCTVALNRDIEAIAFAFNYRGESPALTCPCHLSVFLPNEAGRAVSGPATEPLPRVRLEVAGDMVRATGLESRATGADAHRTILEEMAGRR